MMVYLKETDELATVIYASYDGEKNEVETTLETINAPDELNLEYHHTYKNCTEEKFRSMCKTHEWWKENRPELCI